MIGRRTLLTGLVGAIGARAVAAPLAKVRSSGRMSVALYRDFQPWSWQKAGKLTGIDVELAQLIGKDMGVAIDPVEFIADENVDDDLRNIVWRGSVAGGGIADIMMHAPIDSEFTKRNDRAAFVAPYHHEQFAIACDGRTIDCDGDFGTLRDRNVAVETDSVPDTYMLGSLGGRKRETVIHKTSGPAAVAAMIAGEVPLVMATRAQIENGLADVPGKFTIRKASIPGLFSTGWDVGIAVKDDSRDLGEQIAKIVAAAVTDGRVDVIFARFGVTRAKPVTV